MKRRRKEAPDASDMTVNTSCPILRTNLQLVLRLTWRTTSLIQMLCMTLKGPGEGHRKTMMKMRTVKRLK